MLSAIAFAIKLIMAVAFTVILSLGRRKLIPRDEVGLYILLSMCISAITVISQQLNIQLLITSVFIVISFVTYYNVKKEYDLLQTIEKIIPLWTVIILGICAGSLMLLQGLALAFLAYFTLNYFPFLMNRE